MKYTQQEVCEYMIKNWRTQSYSEMADHFGLSRQRIHQYAGRMRKNGIKLPLKQMPSAPGGYNGPQPDYAKLRKLAKEHAD